MAPHIPYKLQRKMKHQSGRTYDAYLTPSEVLELVSRGVKLSRDKDSHKKIVEGIRRRKQEGNSQSWWFSLELTDKHLKEMHND